HDGLRMRYEREEGGWRQECGREIVEGLYERRKLGGGGGVGGGGGEREQRGGLEEDARRGQGSLDLRAGRGVEAGGGGRGGGWRGVEYDMGAGGRRLLLVIHHLVVDGVSWRILLEDLERGYRQAAEGSGIDLGAKTTSLRQWGERLRAYGQQEQVRQEVEYWTRGGKEHAEGRLPRDYESAV